MTYGFKMAGDVSDMRVIGMVKEVEEELNRQIKVNIIVIWIQATLLNPDMCNPDFRLNRSDWKVPVPFYTYNSYTHNLDFV